jgi:hypothetical protein
MTLTDEQVARIWNARETIRGVVNTQKSQMTDLAVIALQDAAIDIGDVVLEVRMAVLADLESAS